MQVASRVVPSKINSLRPSYAAAHFAQENLSILLATYPIHRFCYRTSRERAQVQSQLMLTLAVNQRSDNYRTVEQDPPDAWQVDVLVALL